MNHLVLLADDNEELRRALADVMEDAGYSVVQAATGKDALTHLNSSTEFDLFITDLVMPDITGLERIILLKKSHPKLAIVAMSFDKQFLYVANWFEVEATLQKPFEISTLLKTVDSVLLKRQLPALKANSAP
jgi:CheY-like chemotaxis protein